MLIIGMPVCHAMEKNSIVYIPNITLKIFEDISEESDISDLDCDQLFDCDQSYNTHVIFEKSDSIVSLEDACDYQLLQRINATKLKKKNKITIKYALKRFLYPYIW
jgi:hypothetical protein